MEHKYNKGSEWRKWDLHVHTPDSLFHNYNADESTDVWDKFIIDIESLPKEIKVIGINDYLFIDGYRRILEEKSKGRMSNIELFLPVIELRIAKFGGNKQFKRVNFHVIFSDYITPDVIQGQFLNALSAKYTLTHGVSKDWWGGVIDKENLQKLGEKIIESIPINERINYTSPIKEGFNNLNLDESQIFEVLHNYHGFEGKFITAIGKTEWDDFKWNDNSISEKKTIINNVDIVFTAAETVEKFRKAKEKLKEQNVNDLLLDCSDAHYNIESNNKDRLGNCNTWIKADPTFEGLKQVLNEPEDRVYIGDEPPLFKRVKNDRTKYLNSIKINHIATYSGQYGKWFDNIEIDLNKELVAIIGNKGSGKSAIADMIALCSNQENQEEFSFLNKNKFRLKNLASHFETEISFENGSLIKKNLGDTNVESLTKLIKYLPQGYFERLCNEISKVEAFKKEIESVVFQYVDETDRLGASDFDALITQKKHSIDEKIKLFCIDIDALSIQLFELDKKRNSTYKKGINDQITQKQAEINALIMPIAVSNPNDNPELSKENEEVIRKIEQITTDVNSLEIQIEGFKAEKTNLLNEIHILSVLKSKLISLKEQSEVIIRDNNIETLGLSWDKIMNVGIDTKPIEDLEKEKKERVVALDIQIGLREQPANSTLIPLFKQIENKKSQVEEEQKKLSGPQQAYQKYQEELTEYNQQKKNLEGQDENPSANTLKWLKNELLYLEDKLASDIDSKFNEVIVKICQIYQSKKEIVDIYTNIKSKIDAKIKENTDLLEGFEITIDASLSINSNFKTIILNSINKNIKGSFYNIENAELRLKRIIESKDVDNVDAMIELIKEVRDNLIFDKRDGQNNDSRNIEDQVTDVLKFYKELFSLDYLSYNYQLQQNGKKLECLSPGEKGALLLVFYLLLDMDNKPLILDQPEDNLDNGSVAKILVKFIKRAKSKRQIIMVTHNPNLAVVADAEQVIYVNIDKEHDNLFSYESGSIENTNINKRIVDVLEGAMPAFNKRKEKYHEDNSHS